MSETLSASRQQARALLAAALIQSKTIDLTSVFFRDKEAAMKSPSVEKLKAAVDALLDKVIYA